jgi:hypothetical protein
MVNISKQDTSNISEIIDQALDVLNDISLTIECMNPVHDENYQDNYLFIEEESFQFLFGHKRYLVKKYIRESSFTKRIEGLEAAQQRIKLIMKSMPTNKQSFSTSVQLKKKPSMTNKDQDTKNKSFIQRNNEKLIEIEKLCQAKDIEIMSKAEQIKQHEAKIKVLEKENEKNKSEIVELNNLVSPTT